MYCPSCGKELADEDRFCRFCGRATGPAGATPNPATTPPGNAVTVRNVYEGKNTVVVGLLIFFVGLFILMGSCVAGVNGGDNSWPLGIGALLSISGLIIYLVGRFKHWYHAE